MAYENGAATDLADLIDKLFTFATANGWTEDDLDTGNGEASLHNTGGRCFVAFRWNTSTPNNLAMYCSLGFGIGVSVAAVNNAGTGYAVGDILTVAGGTSTAAATIEVLTITGGGSTGPIGSVRVASCGINYTVNPTLTGNSVSGGTGSGATMDLTMGGTNTTPGNSCDNDGQGFVTSTDSGSGSLERSRGVYELGDGPFTYYFFQDSTPDYIHAVIVSASGVHRHISFGVLDKTGDWYGGEYCAGHTHTNGTLMSTVNCVSLDGGWFNTSTFGVNAGTENRGPSLHMEGVVDQDPASKWGLFFNSEGSSAQTPNGRTDREGNPYQTLLGGFKRNMFATAFGWIASNANNGYVPFYSIAAWYWDFSVSPDEVRLLGYQPGIRGANIKGFTPGEEITIGAQTWVMFPVSRKANTGADDDSGNMGLAYLKVA